MHFRQIQPENRKTGLLQRELAKYLPLITLGGALALGACSLKAPQGTQPRGRAPALILSECAGRAPANPVSCSLKNPDFLKHFDTRRMESAPLNSLETISRLPYAEMSRFLGLRGGDTVNISYPAAGTHIAALQLGLMLQRIADFRISYTFTELRAHAQETIEEFAKLLVAPYIVQKDFRKDADGATFELAVFGKPATVRYVFLDKGDSLPMRVPHDIALKTDIFFMHDSMDRCEPTEYCDLETFAFGGIYAAVSGKPKIVINEDVAHVMDGRHPKSVYDILPQDGREGIRGVPGDFGCPFFDSGGALVYFPGASAYLKMMHSQRSLRRFNNDLGSLAFDSNGHLGGGWGTARETLSGKISRGGPVYVSHFETATKEIREKYARR
jgi:hypothetical protein